MLTKCGYKAGKMHQNVMFALLLFKQPQLWRCCVATDRFLYTVHEPLECQDSAGLLNKCSRWSKCILHHAIACNRYFMSTGHLFFVSSTDKDVHLRNHLQKLLCVSPFLFHLDPISECENNRKHAKLMAKRPNSRLGFEAVLFEVTDLRPTLWREPLTGSSKIFKNKVFESLQKWLDRVSQIFLTVSIRRSVLDCDILRCHDVQMRPVSCRDCGACSACNAPGPSAEPSAPGSEGRPNDPGSCWGSCAASDVSKASLTFLRHLTWTQHGCQWLGSVGDLPMLLHNSVPFEASLSVVWIAWELWSVSM